MKAQDLNTLVRFLALRDIAELTPQFLSASYHGLYQADVFVLFGGSIIEGGDVLAKAIQNKLARHYLIVGGAGHTTDGLRRQMALLFPDLNSQNLTEAELFAAYIRRNYQLTADLLETQSTNCGNNITLMLNLLEKSQIEAKSFILCQDAAMQLRMSATLKKFRPDALIINYAAYQAFFDETAEDLKLTGHFKGMWETERYISLLMGEIPRLRDDESGYGPNGAAYLAHAEIPLDVEASFARLSKEFGAQIRQANPAYKSEANDI
ncbi:YdcF family protein [Streptococcus dentiloxodontae]